MDVFDPSKVQNGTMYILTSPGSLTTATFEEGIDNCGALDNNLIMSLDQISATKSDQVIPSSVLETLFKEPSIQEYGKILEEIEREIDCFSNIYYTRLKQ